MKERSLMSDIFAGILDDFPHPLKIAVQSLILLSSDYNLIVPRISVQS